ncbi:LITAF-like zinc ribbon domain-containing protein [Talaromyces proteolyticus]|uniref:LITAF-like zinc ribbon domain-containing protein n=1 Tax=Talaromyces proteolyticus TaxID=1131652 RepID=A0AAD4Q2H3_9EURO|nr:LITAF-like zinc ribbon domain-containing protein [Talaromyces proteolyticus]KAH8700432.1 LITAF-like zinc ribbon domain-containing protein [Talaromyces proteolyticus]
MELHNQNDGPPPAYSNPPAGGSAPEIAVIEAATEPQHTVNQGSEKIALVSPDAAIQTASTDVAATSPPADELTKTIPGQPVPQVTPLEKLNDQPALIDCPFCQYRAMTRVNEEDSSQTSIAALFCCIFCGIIGACIPYICKWAQDFHHFCTHCNAKVAIRSNEGPVQVLRPTPVSVPSAYPAAPPKVAQPVPVKGG